ncbi:MAG: hypothetical protein ACRCUT_12990, partial [Spirochaetota bacterium]
MKKYLLLLSFVLCLQIPAAGAEKILLMPFINEGDSDSAWVGAGFYESISAALCADSSVRTVNSSDIRIALGYLGVASEGAITGSRVRTVASLLDAGRVVTARYRVSAGRLKITMEILNSSDWTIIRKIEIQDSMENIFSVRDALVKGIVAEQLTEYVPPKPVYVTVRKKKKKYTVKKINSYLKPYEWYSRSLILKEKNPTEALGYLIRTLKYDPEHTGALCAAAEIAHNEQEIIDGALGYLLRADRICAKRGESTTIRYAALMLRIADIYEHKKDHTRAQTYISRAQEVWKKHKKERPGEYALVLCEIGNLYNENGEKATALDYYSMAKQVMETAQLQKTLRYVWLMKATGDLYSETGALQESEYYYTRLVGVNNRNLHTFEVNLETTLD